MLASIMNRFLYVLAVILLTVWMISVFIYTVGAIAHLLLLSAIVPIVFLVGRENKSASRVG